MVSSQNLRLASDICGGSTALLGLAQGWFCLGDVAWKNLKSYLALPWTARDFRVVATGS